MFILKAQISSKGKTAKYSIYCLSYFTDSYKKNVIKHNTDHK